MSADIRLEPGGATAAHPHVDQICQLYDEAFSAAPFFWRDDESQLHRERLENLFGDPSFGVVLACSGDKLVGFGYGRCGQARYAALDVAG